EDEGAWDNPWDLQQKKIASLQEQLGMERDPIQRLILRRELGQQYVNGGASEAGIDTLEQLLAEYGPKLPQRDIETLKADIALANVKSDYDIGTFRDVAATRGISVLGRAGGAILEDFDNDGNLDLMISRMGVGDQIEYFHNRGDRTFERKTEEAGLKGIVGGLNIMQADYNNDGCIDVFVPRGAWYHDKGRYPASLL